MIDEARQVTTGLGGVIGCKISLYGLQLTIEARLDTLGRQVEAVDQVDQIADLGYCSLDDDLEAASGGIACWVTCLTVNGGCANGEGAAGVR